MTCTWECGATKWLAISASDSRNITYRTDCEELGCEGVIWAGALTIGVVDVATNGQSATINVSIQECVWGESCCTPYIINSLVIQKGQCIEFYKTNRPYSPPECPKHSGNNLESPWRVCCDDILASQMAQIHICSCIPEGPGPGPAPSGDPLLAAQYFDTTGFGWTGGCIVKCMTENPRSGGGKNTVPTQVEWNLYEWDISYAITLTGASIATDTFIISSEEINDDEVWLPFFWDDLSPGKYMWTLRCVKGPHDGSFRLEYYSEPEYQKWSAWVNGDSHYNFNSKILGITTSETWENIMCIDDTFVGHSFKGLYGHEKIKINTPDGYKDVMTTKKDNNLVIKHPGYAEELTNPSFADGTMNGWSIRVEADCAITSSSDWSSNDSYSAKMYHPPWSCDEDCYFYQMLDIENVTSGWTITWDMKVEGGGTYDLKVHLFGKLVYDSPLFNGTFYNLSGTTNYPVAGYVGYIGFNAMYYCCEIEYSKTIYIDNIRITPPNMGTTAQGRIVGGTSNIKIV